MAANVKTLRAIATALGVAPLDLLNYDTENEPKHGKVRSVLVFVGISTILTAARNARAMFDALRKFFRYVLEFGSVPRRAVSGMATVTSIVILGPGQSGASGDKRGEIERSAVKCMACFEWPV